jgi:dynein heavy chain, axonemal
MKQKINFRILRMIPFFKYYLHRKVFNMWFENVRYQLFLKQRKKVTERLFLARKTTCPAILASKRHLRESRNVHLLSAIGTDFKPSDKDVIMEKQLGQLSKASVQFEEYVRRIIEEVSRVINDINSIHSSAYQDQSSNVLSFTDTITPEKLKSLVRLKQEKAERKQMRYRARIEFQTLPDFIRYMDYLVLENFFDLTLHGIEKFHDEFVRPRKSGIFDTMIRFTNAASGSGVTDTVFSPTCTEIQDMVQKLFDSVIETVGNLNRVGYLTVKSNALGNATVNNVSTITNPNLNASSATNSSIMPLASSIQTILHENKQFRSVLLNIYYRILTDFERAEEHAMTYDAIKPIYKFNNEWSIESYRSHGYDITQLKVDLDRITNWVKDLEKLRNRPIGILDVDSRKLKMELNPILEMRLVEIKEYIKEMARFRCQQLLNHYKDCINKFMARPLVLKEFANQIQFVLTSKEDEKNLFIQTSQVDQMYNLLQSYDVSIPSDDSVLHEQLHDRQNEYKKEIVVVAQFHEQHRNNMVVAVNESIAKLNRNIEKFLEKLDDPDFTMTLHYEDSDTILDDLDLHTSEFKSLNDLAKTYSTYQRLLNEPIAEYKELANGAEKLQTTKKLWETISAWNLSYEEWNDSQFADLDVEDVEKTVVGYYKETLHLNKVISCKATDKLTGQINDFRKILPSILDLGNKHMKTRHFEKLFKLINQVYYSGMPFTLLQIRKGGLMNHKDIIAETSAIASGEAQLEEQLGKVKDTWDKMRFTTKLYREQQNVHVLGPLTEVLAKLDDHQVMIQGMLKSRFIQGLFDRVDAWNQKLNALTDIFDEWMQFQKGWMQLESIFTSEDTPKQLPLETQKFLAIDRSWKLIMTRTVNDPLVLSCLLPLEGTTNPSLLSTLRSNNEVLEMIQKSLEDYIDTKRQVFPRLYVLSNREVLELLSRTKDTHNIHDYISKCFDGVKAFRFQDEKLVIDSIKGKNKGYDEVIGWYGHHEEYVNLSAGNIRLEGSCESWLSLFEQVMKSTLSSCFKDAAAAYANIVYSKDNVSFLSFIASNPTQAFLVADQILFTSDVTGALFTAQVKMTVSTIVEIQAEMNRRIDLLADIIHRPVGQFVRLKLHLLLLQSIYHRDVLTTLRSINSLSSYDWLKQMRYYFDVGQESVNIKQSRNNFFYGYEYISDTSRLVITPLTDSCFLTLSSALAMNQGGALLGSSGIGKSETVLQLSKAFGIQCIFYNCSEALTYRTLGRILGGLAQQGSWICFDEFHHVAAEVLSVMAQQLLSIQSAIKRRALHFDFGGKILPLNSRFGAFITMNTSELDSLRSHDIPDNLKSLFRPLSMLSPNLKVIVEAILTASGYASASALANKAEFFIDLCNNQLSNQVHYGKLLRRKNVTSLL